MKIVTLVCLALFTSSCAMHKEQVTVTQPKIIPKKILIEPVKVVEVEIKTIMHISQNPHDYTSNVIAENLNVTQNTFESHYFKPWNIVDGSEVKNNADWAFKIY